MEPTAERETPEAREAADSRILADYARSHDILDAMVPRFVGGRQVPLNERVRHATCESSAEPGEGRDEPSKEWRELRDIDRALDPTIPGDGTTGGTRSDGSPHQHISTVGRVRLLLQKYGDSRRAPRDTPSPGERDVTKDYAAPRPPKS